MSLHRQAQPSRFADRPALAKALASEDRPAAASGLKASLSFAWRSILKIKHVPEQLLDVTITPVLFLFLFTYLFGGALAGSPEGYLQYLLPGMMVMSVLFTTVYSGVTLNTDLTKGVSDRFRALPIWQSAPLLGSVLGDTARYLIAALVSLAAGLVIGFQPEGGVVGVVAAVALLLVFAFSLSWIFTTIGALLRTPNAVMNLGFIVIFPVTFLSNLFVDPGTMPPFLAAVVNANPVSTLIGTVRDLMHGRAASEGVALTLLASALCAAVFAPITIRLYR